MTCSDVIYPYFRRENHDDGTFPANNENHEQAVAGRQADKQRDKESERKRSLRPLSNPGGLTASVTASSDTD